MKKSNFEYIVIYFYNYLLIFGIASANVGTSTSAAVVSPMKVERNRSVMPLEEGGYTVKLPSGSTERSKAILAKQAKRMAYP